MTIIYYNYLLLMRALFGYDVLNSIHLIVFITNIGIQNLKPYYLSSVKNGNSDQIRYASTMYLRLVFSLLQFIFIHFD